MHASPLLLSFSVPRVLYCSLIFCAITSPATSSSKILYSLFYLKHAMSVTATSHGGRAAEIFFWEAQEAVVTLDLQHYAASWLRREGRRMYTPAEGTWLKFTTSFEIQTQQAKKLSKRKADEIYTELGWHKERGVLSCSHTARCMFCCVVAVDPE